MLYGEISELSTEMPDAPEFGTWNRTDMRSMLKWAVDCERVNLTKVLQTLTGGHGKRGIAMFVEYLDNQWVHEGNGEEGKALALVSFRRDLMDGVYFGGEYVSAEEIYALVVEHKAQVREERAAKDASEKSEREAEAARFRARNGAFENPKTGKRLSKSAPARVLDKAGIKSYTDKREVRIEDDERGLQNLEVIYVYIDRTQWEVAARTLEDAGFIIINSDSERGWLTVRAK